MSSKAFEKSGRERCLILVKAMPHVGQKQGETVCCAGVTLDREWRRQFPIHFRRLQGKKFNRWNWIEYDWVRPRGDRRKESRSVQEDGIAVVGEMKPPERANFLAPLILHSTDEAAQRGQSLTLIRPISPRFGYERKSKEKILREKQAYIAASSQGSFLDEQLQALEPCPYEFRFDYSTMDGKSHSHACGDWETAATFRRFERKVGERGALAQMQETFGVEYPKKGMVLAMGTHSQRPEQWLLVGVIRLDTSQQLEFL